MSMHDRWKSDEDAGMQPCQKVTVTNPEMARKYEEAFRMYDLTGDKKHLDILFPPTEAGKEEKEKFKNA